MKRIHSAFFILILILSYPEKSYLQVAKDFPVQFTSKLNINNSDVTNSLIDSLKKKSSEKPVFKMKKSPWKAVAYSAVLPGAGQFYNKSYWKIPVIAGLGGYFVYEWVKNNNEYLDYKTQYQNSQTVKNPAGNPQLQYLREFYRDQRDNFIIYSLILYVVNLIDAYVDAQLYDFDVSDSIKLGLLKKDKFLKLSLDF
ncbi:MAG TPA: DUF5683 domain-containing protein [Ignavibacteria bacterium]|nr:DUF5683 domain-containing protein [Ignavibacteria bacterium]